MYRMVLVDSAGRWGRSAPGTTNAAVSPAVTSNAREVSSARGVPPEARTHPPLMLLLTKSSLLMRRNRPESCRCRKHGLPCKFRRRRLCKAHR